MAQMREFKMVKNSVVVTFQAGGDICIVDGVRVSVELMNNMFHQLKKGGFTVLPKSEAPKEPEAPKTRNEALTEKYGDKTARQQYMRTKKYLEGAWRRGILKNRPELKGKEFHDAVMLGVNNDLKKWEANGRPDIIKKLGR